MKTLRRDTVPKTPGGTAEVEQLRAHAEQGYADAQSDLGFMYAAGDGVPKDDREAVRWLQRAAEQGHAGAQTNLGVMYATGAGVPEDAREAVRLYRLAAEQGHAGGQFNLGFMYDAGRGVSQDVREAARWFRLAAGQGDARAQFNLGCMYTEGRGVERDDREAVRWLRLAAGQGDAAAQYALGVMYREGRGVVQDDEVAVRWLRLAADQGDAAAQFNLGVMYRDGWDDREAVRWLRLAAEQGHAEAQAALGLMRDRGSGKRGGEKERDAVGQSMRRKTDEGLHDLLVLPAACLIGGAATAGALLLQMLQGAITGQHQPGGIWHDYVVPLISYGVGGAAFTWTATLARARSRGGWTLALPVVASGTALLVLDWSGTPTGGLGVAAVMVGAWGCWVHLRKSNEAR